MIPIRTGTANPGAQHDEPSSYAKYAQRGFEPYAKNLCNATDCKLERKKPHNVRADSDGIIYRALPWGIS
jgi:hypothetical protein